MYWVLITRVGIGVDYSGDCICMYVYGTHIYICMYRICTLICMYVYVYIYIHMHVGVCVCVVYVHCMYLPLIPNTPNTQLTNIAPIM